ncbi:hypothetical protein NDO71_orf224 [Klebsiella phage vB_KpnM_NDO71]|nr:hypothetical protein NDO71_orf224 [Klebsiella phage vB_KpnM_NDO71]
MIYKNQFRNIWRKFVNGKGYVSGDQGLTWTESGAPQDLIKRLPYYVERKDGKIQIPGF